MKKLLTVLLATLLVAMLAVTASADFYGPAYYGAAKVDAITVDGAVDEAYGEPIFYYEAYGPEATEEEIGAYTNPANWFFTTNKSESQDDVLALVYVEENYARGYAAWTDTAVYICIDTNILGYNFDPSLATGNMWQAYSVQLDIFDHNNNSNVDWGMAVDANGETRQMALVRVGNAVMNNNADGVTEFDCVVTRDGERVVYEVELPFAEVLSFTPAVGDKIGLDVCINVGEYVPDVGYTQNCLTFANRNAPQGYHSRSSAHAIPLYFVESAADADKEYADAMNAGEIASDEHSISLFGCNEVLPGMAFKLDTEEKQAGLGSLYIITEGKDCISRWALPSVVDGTGYDTLEFDLYLSDPEFLTKAAGLGQLELRNDDTDDFELRWDIETIVTNNQGGELTVGWNHIILPLDTGVDAGDDFDISKISHMGLYVLGAAPSQVAVMVDNFRLTDKQAVVEQAARDAAAAMDERIAALDEVTADNYVSVKIRVSGAMSAYEKMTDLEKSFVSAEMVAKLEAAVAAIAAFEENPPVDPGEDDPVDPPVDDDPVVDPPVDDDPVVDPPVDDDPVEKPAKNNKTVIIIVIAAVVVVAVVVFILCLTKKKA